MKIIITIHKREHIEKLLSVTDGVVLGHHDFGTRLTSSFSIEDINDVIALSKKMHKDVFINANQMMTDDQLAQFSVWLDQINVADVTGIIASDLGALVLLKQKGLNPKAVYNPETLITNTYDFNFLTAFNLLGVYAAKEITLEDLIMIGQEKSLKMFMVGHGHLNMFYSKRQLIQNYLDFLNETHELHLRQDLTLIEEHRQEDHYPILEDEAGTHVFRSHVMHAMHQQAILKSFLDYLVIDTIFKDDHYGYDVALMYHTEQKDMIKTLQEKYHETWDEGFFFKKTIYKGKGGES